MLEQYDSRGQLTRFVTANGDEIRYGYDLLGQVVARYLPDGSQEGFEYNANGLMTRATNAVSDYLMSYDAAERLVSVKDAVSGLEVRYEYGPGGRREAVIDPAGGETRYGYGASGLVERLRGPAGLEWTFVRGPDGAIRGIRYPDGRSEEIEYDKTGRITSDGVKKYRYDENGNVAATTGADGFSTFEYDPLDRLVRAAYADGRRQEFRYDTAGNRMPGVYDAANRLLSEGSVSFTYDGEGNRTSRRDAQGETVYRYDADNRLVGVRLPDGRRFTYKYDVFGRRVEKAMDGGPVSQFIYDGHALLLEIRNGEVEARYTQGLAIDDVLAVERKGENFLFQTDRLGTVTALLDMNGSVVESYGYDAFGQLLQPRAGSNRFLFTGREYDGETGLYFYRARHYDPSIGRFLQQDPVWDAANPQSRQLYSYAFNNPLRWRDPSGEFPPDPFSVNPGSGHGGGHSDGRYRPPVPPAGAQRTDGQGDFLKALKDAGGVVEEEGVKVVKEGAKISADTIFRAMNQTGQWVLRQAQENPKKLANVIIIGGVVGFAKAAFADETAPLDYGGQAVFYLEGAGIQFDGKRAMDVLTSRDPYELFVKARVKDSIFFSSDERNAFNPAALLRKNVSLVWDCNTKSWVSVYRLR